MVDKPLDTEKYVKWLGYRHKIVDLKEHQRHYEKVVPKMNQQFANSPFWVQWSSNLREFNDEFRSDTGYPLLSPLDIPNLEPKEWENFLDKTHRKNVITNPNWPKPPPGGWILPNNWFSKINDIIRTSVVVKYLDGVDFLIKRTNSLCKQHKKEEANCDFEAKAEGYYAAHMYIAEEFEIPTSGWDTEKVRGTVEIQITTQIQEVIRSLLHKYYEETRSRILPESEMVWQWRYESPEFTTYYLGHILHYVEGMIMAAREKESSHGKV